MRFRAGVIGALSLVSLPALADEVRWPSFHWSDPGAAPALLELKSAFEAENPGDTIENVDVPVPVFWDKQLADVTSGNPGDVVTMYDPEVRAYIEQRLLLPLDDYLKEGGIDGSDFVPTASLGVKDGKTYAVPFVVNARALFYNEELLKQAGVTPPANADQFYDVAKALRQADQQQFGFATASKPGNANLMYIEIMPIIAGFGGGFFKQGKPNATAPETVAALSLYKKLYDENLIPRGVETGAYRDMFAQGKIGMYATGAFFASVVAKANPTTYEHLRAMPLPLPTGKTMSITVFFGIPKGSKNPDLAAKVLLRMLQRDMQMKIALTGKAHPGRVGMLPPGFFDENPWFKAFEQATLTAQSYAPDGAEQYGVEIIKIVSEHIEGMLFDDTPPDEAAGALQAALEKLMASKQ